MSWIKTVPYQDATGKLKMLYDRVKGADNNVDNIMMAQSLRPHSMEGHMTMYKNVLHHSGNRIPKWFLEVIGVWVSSLNNCSYCVEHHFGGLTRLLADDAKSAAILKAVEAGDLAEAPLSSSQKQAMAYAEKLTLSPQEMVETDVKMLREADFSDGEILEINQVVAYFNYANRTVVGLGCSTEGDIIGLSPNDSDDPENWNHT